MDLVHILDFGTIVQATHKLFQSCLVRWQFWHSNHTERSLEVCILVQVLRAVTLPFLTLRAVTLPFLSNKLMESQPEK